MTDAQVNKLGVDVMFGGLFGMFVTAVTLPSDAGISTMIVVWTSGLLGGLLSVRRTAVGASRAGDIK